MNDTWVCPGCGVRYSKFANSRIRQLGGAPAIVCIHCAADGMTPYRKPAEVPAVNPEPTREFDRVRNEVRALLEKLTAEQRVAFLGECFAAFCRSCGYPLRGKSSCYCENDE